MIELLPARLPHSTEMRDVRMEELFLGFLSSPSPSIRSLFVGLEEYRDQVSLGRF